MKETRKARKRRINSPLFQKIFKGKGVDIGSGRDPIDKSKWENITELELFEIQHGDAQHITDFLGEGMYDFVYSSHCLEHMVDPQGALIEWWKLVKKGGYFVLVVPDEDLYEQGFFPSRYNRDHKYTFTIYKNNSWSPKSINILDIIKSIDCKVIKVELIDTCYNYDIKERDQSRGKAETSIEIILLKSNK